MKQCHNNNPTEEQLENLKQLKKQAQKAARKDRDNFLATWVDETLTSREQWQGVKQLKKGYTPRRFERHDKHNNRIPREQQAEATADYLETIHWKHNTQETQLTAMIPNTPLNKTPPSYNIDPITVTELSLTIKHLKNNKTPGPDTLEAELVKALPPEAEETLLQTLNTWWQTNTPQHFCSQCSLHLRKRGPQTTSKLQTYFPPQRVLQNNGTDTKISTYDRT